MSENHVFELSSDMFVGDEVDQAFGNIYVSNEHALQNVLKRSRPENQPNYDEFDGEHCVDCEEPLNEFRLKNKFIRCVHCQEILEHKDKMYARS